MRSLKSTAVSALAGLSLKRRVQQWLAEQSSAGTGVLLRRLIRSWMEVHPEAVLAAELWREISREDCEPAAREPGGCRRVFSATDDLRSLAWSLQYLRENERRACSQAFDSEHKIDETSIAAATQLFTPDWLAEYMVQNSLGRLWMQLHPHSALATHMPYYRPPLPKEPPVAYREPEEIAVLDPACGSGLLLLTAYDWLEQMYAETGRAKESIPELILRHNLRGWDIDPDALLLARCCLSLRAGGASAAHLCCPAAPLIGSLAHDLPWQAQILICNPPYLGHRKMSRTQAAWARAHYPASSDNLATMFLQKALESSAEYAVMLMPSNWMALSRYADLRRLSTERGGIRLLLEMGASAFPDLPGEVIAAAVCVCRVGAPAGMAELCDISSARRTTESAALFKEALLSSSGRLLDIAACAHVPGGVISPRITPARARVFSRYRPMGERFALRQGLATGDNGRFVRYWWQVDHVERYCADAEAAMRSGARWFPYNKGGEACRWYGNQLHVVNWEHDGAAIRSLRAPSGRLRSRPQNREYYFRPSVSWNKIGMRGLCCRWYQQGFIFDMAGPSLFADSEEELLAALSFLNADAAAQLLSVLSPTINTEVGHVSSLPWGQGIAPLPVVRELLALTRDMWDEQEISMDFEVHPLFSSRFADCGELESALTTCLKHREERLARIRELEWQNQRAWSLAYDLPLPTAEPLMNVRSRSPHCRAETKESSEATLLKSAYSYLLGCSAGRWGHLGGMSPENVLEQRFGTQGVGDFCRLFRNYVGSTPAEFLQAGFAEYHSKVYRGCPIYTLY